MVVTWTQINNGLPAGVTTTAATTQSLAEARAFLEAKAASHEAHGWAVVRAIDQFAATKTYASGRVKNRTFTIGL
jgi:hypothetical protein